MTSDINNVYFMEWSYSIVSLYNNNPFGARLLDQVEPLITPSARESHTSAVLNEDKHL